MPSRSLAILLVSFLPLTAQAFTIKVTNTNASGAGSLAQAIAGANAIPSSKIVFDIHGTPPFTIDLAAPLPPIVENTRIDASTQPGYANAAPVVTLVGHRSEPLLDLRAPAVIAALGFRLEQGPAIVTAGATIDRCTFERSGAPSDVETAAIRFVKASGGGVLSSTFAFGTGIEIVDSANVTMENDTFAGCYRSAIALVRSSKNTIGRVGGNKITIGPSVAAGQPAIAIDAASNGNVVENVSIAGAAAGIDVAGNDTRILSNTIHDVDGWAVRVNGGRRNWIDSNSIYNAGAAAGNAIVLVNGGNADVAPPAIASADVTPSGTTIKGTALAQTSVALYVSESCVVPNGQLPLASGSFSGTSFAFTVPPVKPGWFVTGATWRSEGSTGVDSSAFSSCVVAKGSADGPAPMIASVEAVGIAGSSLTVRGSNFAQLARVFVGANEALDCRGGGSSLFCAVPAGSGTADVAVENPDGKRAVSAGGVTYVEHCNELWVNSTSGDAVTNGTPVTLSTVVSTNTPPLAYLWSSNGTTIAGENGPSITVPAPSIPTPYNLHVATACSSRDVSFVVWPCSWATIIVSGQPADATAAAGAPATFCVSSTNGPVASYQWYEGAKGNTTRPLPNGNGECVKVTAGQVSAVWVRLSNGCNSADSRAATLTPLRRRAAGK